LITSVAHVATLPKKQAAVLLNTLSVLEG